MFSSVYQEVKELFGRGFLFVAFLPLLVVSGASFALYAAVLGNFLPLTKDWAILPVTSQILTVTAGVAVLVLMAMLLTVSRSSLLSLYQGYWPSLPLLNWYRTRLTRYYIARLEWWEEEATKVASGDEVLQIYDLLNRFFPPVKHAKRTMPTRLGNVLRVAELYAYDRYQIDSEIHWPRLRLLIPPQTAKNLDDYQLTLDAFIVLSFLSASFALIWGIILFCWQAQWYWFILVALGWPLSALFYHGAVNASLDYADQICTIFDLHRGLILEAMKRFPRSSAEERREFHRLNAFWSANVPLPDPDTGPEPTNKSLEIVASLSGPNTRRREVTIKVEGLK